MMGLRVKKEALDAIIAEVDEDSKKFDSVFIIMNFGHLFTQTMKKGILQGGKLFMLIQSTIFLK